MTTHCGDTSEAVELCPSRCLFLKPVAKIHISVQLPTLKIAGKSISNWEVMEKVKATVKPERFLSLKVVKSALEFVRLEGELESRALIQRLVARLDGSSMKLSGYPEQLRVRAAEARQVFPARHDWDSFFRGGGGAAASSGASGCSGTSEVPTGHGHRPDTVHIRDLPCKWFAAAHAGHVANAAPLGIGTAPVADRPSEDVVRQVFQTFGEIRAVDVPMLDPYREEIAAASAVRSAGAIATFSFSQDLNFEVFIQYKEYISFVKALEALKGMRLLYKSSADGNAYTANIKVDFDKTSHMSEKAIRKRQHEREKLERLEKEREEKKRQEKDAEERRKQEERRSTVEEATEREQKQLDRDKKHIERDRAREERRARKRQERQRRAEAERLRREEAERRAQEEQKRRDEEQREAERAAEQLQALIKLRCEESTRMLRELFRRVEKAKVLEDIQRKERELKEEQERLAEEEKKREELERLRQEEEQRRRKEALEHQERELREKMLRRLRDAEERKQEERREQLRRQIAGHVRLRSTVVMKK